MAKQRVSVGKPSEYGQEVVRRRFRLLRQIVALEHKRVVDFGCGNGAQTVELAGCGCRVLAVDIAPHNLQRLRVWLEANKTRNIQPVCYDGERLPVRHESVDLVLSFDVLEHVADEGQAVASLYRILKPGADLVITVPNKAWVFETHGANLPLLPWNRVPFFSWLPPALHSRWARARIYTRRNIVRLLEQHAFEVQQTAYVTAPLDVLPNGALKRGLQRALFRNDTTRLPFLATQVLVHARKPAQAPARAAGKPEAMASATSAARRKPLAPPVA